MHRFTSNIRRPVRRPGAEQYLLITLLSFAASVSLTRLFLEMTGYPQLGGGELHIAHVLWGGLLLFIAAILPLLVANRWSYLWGSILAGTGVGLFIDEVGKFITQSNNYFYPLAAPIIYAFFLLTVLIYLRVRKPETGEPRSELYQAFDSMEEVLDHDLDSRERDELKRRLKHVIETSDQPDLKRLAIELMEFLESDAVRLVPQQPPLLSGLKERWRSFEAKYISRQRLTFFLAGGLVGLGLVSLWNMSRALPIGAQPTSLETIMMRLIEAGQLRGQTSLNWFAARLALESTVGLLLIVSAGLLIAGKTQLGVSMAYLGLLLSLTTVDLLVFYFDQFSTILTAGVQFGLLLLLSYFRDHFT
jgi:hypothetical protein